MTVHFSVYVLNIINFVFTPFKQLLVSVGLEDYHLIAVWDWRKGRVLASVRGHSDRVTK